MNFIDLILLFIILSSGASGWHRGFLAGSLDLIRWVGSILLGLRFYPEVAGWLGQVVDWNEILLAPVAFIVVTLGSGFLLQLLGYAILKQLPAQVHPHRFNKVLGLLPGLLSGLIATAFLAVLLLAIPLPGGLQTAVDNSKLVNRFAAYTDRLETALSPVFDEAVNRTLNRLTIEPGSAETVELPFKFANARPMPDLEAQMLELVNGERAKHGLKPLQPDTALTRVARLHAADMFRRGYFSHYTPEGLDPFDRIRKGGIRYRAAGENLALAPTLKVAHEGLMNSPGHRANILQQRFGRVGIGILKSPTHQLMITQKFRN